jgi:hypothetical protein
MAQITFTRWCMDPAGRTSISVDPTRVESTEFFIDAYQHPNGEKLPAATKITMRNRQEYIVQGASADIVSLLNNGA